MTVVYKSKGETKDIELVQEEQARIGVDPSSETSNKSENYKDEAQNATQKHKPKKVESVNADAEAFAKPLEHTKKRDAGHQSVSLENKTGDSTMLKIGDSAKVVIKQDMKGRRHKYGFNNNKREKAQKKRVVDDQTGDKHQLDEQERLRKKLALEEGRIFAIMGSPSAFTPPPPPPPPPPPTSDASASPSAVDITYENWKEVPTAQKDLIWEDIQAEFDIPEASDSKTKRKLLQTVGERWRQFKSNLTRKWALAADQDGVEDTVCDKYGISKEKWAQFCQTRRDPSLEDVRMKAQAIQKQNTAPELFNFVVVSPPKPPPKPDPEVRWDATVFGVVNPDFPLYIKHEDLSEIAHDGQCLSISLLQLWILHLTETCMRVGNSDIYGFLEPQSIQRSRQSQFHCSGHWQMVVILPKEHLLVWFCSLHNRPDNYLKGIINSAIKGLDDAPQPKSKASARWIVVKCNRQKGSTECGYYVMHWMSTIILGTFRNNWEAYFNDPRPLEPERLKALRIQWAQFYLRVRDQA
ncbi:hypothetical protein HKD37_09G025175 [Glycine soja]